jgi:hypothetical protein
MPSFPLSVDKLLHYYEIYVYCTFQESFFLRIRLTSLSMSTTYKWEDIQNTKNIIFHCTYHRLSKMAHVYSAMVYTVGS